ncbi:MAG: ammonium transporter [Myxococcales bacterium]|nr:ammonium transporter [Myxococcales bacterium]
MLRRLRTAAAFFVPLLVAAQAAAETAAAPPAPGPVDGADTAWVMVSAALVLLMTPGLALFYGGMVRAKNVLSTLMHSFVCISLITILWVTIGYSLAFSEGNPFIGGFEYAFLAGVGAEAGPAAATIPHDIFMLFQLMFAIITPAIISGAFAERIKFRAFVGFTLAWSLLVYTPICHWVWGPGGWLSAGSQWHALDFAGGTVVHISSGVAGLTMALVLGKRKTEGDTAHQPHNLPLTLLGAGLLWFGWFGFNGGSALASGGGATHAFVLTHIAAACAALSWMVVERVHSGRITLLGTASGAVAGLVGITPACGFVELPGALIIGFGAGAVCYFGVQLKNRLKVDDSLDAFGLHGVGGAFGAIATGLFASAAIGEHAGLFEGGEPRLALNQLVGVVVVAGYSFVVTLIIAKVLNATVGLRVSAAEEQQGLDELHGERGYALDHAEAGPSAEAHA